MYKNVLIVYFSGTGGTKRVAEVFEDKLVKHDCKVSTYALDLSVISKHEKDMEALVEQSDLIVVVFAVHAIDAPDPVYRWMEKLQSNKKNAAVISVSGGGETWPNLGCRNNIIFELEKKGFEVVYEKMLVMPCNWVFSINDDLTVRLLEALPNKAEKIINQILSGDIRRTRYKKGIFASWLTKGEKKESYKFAKKIRINEKCSGCGWCATNCPMGNISIKDGKPAFEEKCIICFRCIYGCPRKAMESKNFMVLKKGFDISAVEKRMEGKQPVPIEKCAKGIFYKGMRNYLMDKDK